MRLVWLVLILFLGLGVWKYLLESQEQLLRCSQTLHRKKNGEAMALFGRVERKNAFFSIAGIHLTSRQELLPYEGRNVSVTGILRCSLPPQNPGRVDSIFSSIVYPQFYFSVKEIRLRSGPATFSVRSSFERWLSEKFKKYPTLLALEGALWFGDLAGFSRGVQEFYLVSGSLAVLALSGQHVAGLFILVETLVALLLFLPFRWLGGKKRSHILDYFKVIKNTLPLFCSAILLYTSGFSPSMVRTTMMAFCICLVRLTGVVSSITQVLGTSAATLILFNPHWILSPGFILSVFATLTLFTVSQKGLRQSVLHYLVLAFFFPLVMLGWTSYYFSKMAWASFFLQLPLSFLWDFCVVPLGFCLPLCVVLFGPNAPFFFWIERVLGSFFAGHEIWTETLATTYLASVRVTDAELFLLQCGLLGVAHQIVVRAKKESAASW